MRTTPLPEKPESFYRNPRLPESGAAWHTVPAYYPSHHAMLVFVLPSVHTEASESDLPRTPDVPSQTGFPVWFSFLSGTACP